MIDPLMMERFLAPTGPYGRVLRPGDGMEPMTIAYVQCAGSRDETQGIEYCSRTCCMYAIKQSMLISGALPLADVTIYYMDIRTFGKGYEQFYQNAKAMGVEFVRGKVAKITEDENHNPIVRVEVTEDGSVVERTHDLVVLSLGMVAGDPLSQFGLKPDEVMAMSRFRRSMPHPAKPSGRAYLSPEQPAAQWTSLTALSPPVLRLLRPLHISAARPRLASKKARWPMSDKQKIGCIYLLLRRQYQPLSEM